MQPGASDFREVFLRPRRSAAPWPWTSEILLVAALGFQAILSLSFWGFLTEASAGILIVLGVPLATIMNVFLTPISRSRWLIADCMLLEF